jgi:hypothetical protein
VPARARIAAAALSVCLGAGACGGPAASLYGVIRSGAIPGADITLVPSGDGTVTCDGHSHELPDPLLLTAENLADAMTYAANKRERLSSGPRPVYTYVVTTPSGTFSFSDDSPHLGPTMRQTAAWVYTVTTTVCRHR